MSLDPSASPFHIRMATLADVQAVAEVHVAAWNHAYKGILPDETLAVQTVEKRVTLWERVLLDVRENPERHAVWVGVDEAGKMQGFLHGGKEREADVPFDAELYAIYLHPSVQRRGLGSRLAGHLAEWCVTRGHRTLRLWVLEHNPARAFYERLGGRLLAGAYDDTYAGQTVRHVSYGWDDLSALAGRLPR